MSLIPFIVHAWLLHNCPIIYSTRHKETIWETKKHVNKNKSVEWKAKEMLMEKTIKCVFVISQQYLRNFSSTTIQAPDLLIPFIMFSINRRRKLITKHDEGEDPCENMRSSKNLKLNARQRNWGQREKHWKR